MTLDGKPRARVGVIGGGIVGLATARALLARDAGLDVTVLEKEQEVATHQSTRNSGVVHAGIYYQPGSLKARLCRRGAELLAEYCRDRGLYYEACGKLVVAVDRDEVRRLDTLMERARANGVPGLRRIGPSEILDIEPHASGLAALHSPETAIVDFAAVARSFARDVEAQGGTVRTGSPAVRIERRGEELVVDAGGRRWRFDYLIGCAGAQADRLAALTGAAGDPRIVPFRGRYLRLRPERRGLVRGLIYPVPDPRYPFLGVHLTRRWDGEVLIGPNAFLTVSREAGQPAAATLRDAWDTLRWKGFWRLVPAHVRTGAGELTRTLSRRAFAREARRYVPALAASDTLPGPFGIRAQSVGADGALTDDFLVAGDDRVLHVRNAPSPAATSSLALGELVAGAIPAAAGGRIAPLATPEGG